MIDHNREIREIWFKQMDHIRDELLDQVHLKLLWAQSTPGVSFLTLLSDQIKNQIFTPVRDEAWK